MEQALVTRIVEAALLAATQPLTVVQLRGLFTLDEPAPEGSIEQALDELREQCATRGIELVETASGWRFQVQHDVHAWVARLWTERQTRYTRATLETLAIIAYRQPITRGEIEQVRGVAVSSNIIKALEEREWIRTVGHRDVPGKPELLGTTKIFLDYFGLKSLDQLPPLSELKDFGELDPQLSFTDPDAPKPAADGSIAAGVQDVDAPGERADDATANDDGTPVAIDDATDGTGNEDNDDSSDDMAGDTGLTADDAGSETPHHEDTSNDVDGEPAADAPTTDDDADPSASDDSHTALVDDDDSTGA
ncbi:SMC-Scp complex subunit ScpB [Lysobacter brunescens]|uniref:SMC-Scp complex subunit ScpB n=1 Tax=Lysobacter brunescens TaxID=262323 RepID=A0ABW2YGV4_9GAMM